MGRGTGEGLHLAAESKVPLVLYLCFLPNVAVVGGFYLDTLFPTYTIGYEEQFYLIWPLLLPDPRRTLFAAIAIYSVLTWLGAIAFGGRRRRRDGR